jgi:hypothetical protein
VKEVLTRVIRIFASSPGDVMDERRQLAAVVEELNVIIRALMPDEEVRLELIRWETDTHPGILTGPQSVVDEQLGHDFDVFVGMMWSRFGTPTPHAGSGTEEEFRAAYAGWEARRHPAHVLFYFCAEPVAPESVLTNIAQYQAMSAFRSELESIGLIGSYASHAAFADKIRRDLARVVGQLLHGAEPSEMTERARARASQSDLEVIHEQIAAAARAYEQLRKDMRAGDPRTRRMEVVASTMRTLAPSSIAIVDELIGSESPGKRLAAVTALQAIPDVGRLPWLAERIAAEKPFIGYHAAVALVAAARELPQHQLPDVASAIDAAEAAAARLPADADRTFTLRNARRELDRRLSGASPAQT